METTKEVPRRKTVIKNVIVGRNPDTNRPYFRQVRQPVIPPEGIEPPLIDEEPPEGVRKGELLKEKPIPKEENDVSESWRWTDYDEKD